jgi:hypothetical protein
MGKKRPVPEESSQFQQYPEDPMENSSLAKQANYELSKVPPDFLDNHFDCSTLGSSKGKS